MSHDPLLGPSLGTSATTLWDTCAASLADGFDVVSWDLPGHGVSAAAGVPFTMADLADAVLDAVAPVLADRGAPDEPVHYAGDSVGGAVGLQLLLDHPDRIDTAVLLCTGARIGSPDAWLERAQFVRAEGTAAAVDGSRQRWFGPGFAKREPEVAEALLDALRCADPQDYAAVCEALAGFDVRDRLAGIHHRVLAVAGSADAPTPTSCLAEIAEEVRLGHLEVLDGVGHLAPAESPDLVARLITSWAGSARTR